MSTWQRGTVTEAHAMPCLRKVQHSCAWRLLHFRMTNLHVPLRRCQSHRCCCMQVCPLGAKQQELSLRSLTLQTCLLHAASLVCLQSSHVASVRDKLPSCPQARVAAHKNSASGLQVQCPCSSCCRMAGEQGAGDAARARRPGGCVAAAAIDRRHQRPPPHIACARHTAGRASGCLRRCSRRRQPPFCCAHGARSSCAPVTIAVTVRRMTPDGVYQILLHARASARSPTCWL